MSQSFEMNHSCGRAKQLNFTIAFALHPALAARCNQQCSLYIYTSVYTFMCFYKKDVRGWQLGSSGDPNSRGRRRSRLAFLAGQHPHPTGLQQRLLQRTQVHGRRPVHCDSTRSDPTNSPLGLAFLYFAGTVAATLELGLAKDEEMPPCDVVLDIKRRLSFASITSVEQLDKAKPAFVPCKMTLKVNN